MTNWHVLKGASDAVVVLPSGESYDRVAFLDGDSVADVAVLKIPGFGLPTVQASATLPAVGEQVVVIGSPLGLEQTVSDGIVSATRLVEGRTLLQITAPISPGSSGGPVLDRSGRIVAIAQAFLREGQALNFATPIRYAMGLLGSPRAPRPLAQVFGALTAARFARRDTEIAAGTPRPTANPRQQVFGVYSVRQRIDTSATCVEEGACQPGLLLVGEHDVGWLAVQIDSLDEPPSIIPSVFPVCSFSANSTGQLLLDVCGGGEGAYDGFQTDDGLFFRREAGRVTGELFYVDMIAIPVQLPLSNPTGLYTLSVKTKFYSGKHETSGYTDWQGTAAVVVGRGDWKSLYAELYLENAHGGSTGGSLRGVLKPDRSFVLESSDSTLTYTGFLRAGKLIGTWRDMRGKDRFEGTLEARRR